MTSPALLGGVLPSWYLTLPGCGYVSGTGCVTGEPWLQVSELGTVTSGQEEKINTYVPGSVVFFHLRSEGAIQNSLVREAIKLFNKFPSIRNP